MKKYLFIFVSLGLILLSLQELRSADLKEKIRNKLLYNSSQGREFWIAFPPNDVTYQKGHIIEIYVTSTVNTTVTLEAPSSGDIFKKDIKAFDITTFTSEDNTTRLYWEIRKGETVENKGIRITSPDPISVYAMNGRNASSDGFLAIPVSAFGKKYLHNAYYDYYYHRRDDELGAGFVIVASEDNTRLTIKLRGEGKGMAETFQGGHDIGDVLQVTLNEGETYMVRGDGKTRGVYDLSGSSVEGSKPFGFYSFHMRTDIPSWDVEQGRDHIIEMIPPVTAWGKKYISVEFKRDTDKGDFFRIMCAEPQTKIEGAWYDKSSGELIKRIGPLTLKDEGDFYQYWNGFASPGDEHKGVRGTSIWKADKPIQVYQYTYSHKFDNTVLFDPLMILVMPEEQFVQNTVFQTPSNKKYVNNYFNIIAYHNPEDKDFSDLKSIELDGKPIHSINTQFLLNRIPTTDLYWIKIRVDPGAHHVTSDTRFSGYIYGFQKVDSYGWPACTAFDNLELIDTLAPQIYPDGFCGDYRIETTELRNGNENDNPRQIDMGVEDISLLENSCNYELVIDPDFTPWPATYETFFELKVIDKEQPAKAVYSVTDRAFNVLIDSVIYEPDSLKLTPEDLAYGKVRVNTTKDMDAALENISTKDILIKSIRLQNGSLYEITQGGADTEFTLKSGEIRDITIRYSPDKEIETEDEFDTDTLLVETECLAYDFLLTGQGVMPHIKVDNWDAGRVAVGSKLCRSSIDQGLKITNDGSDTLEVYDIENVTTPFSISNPTEPEFTFKIAPYSYIYFKDICFEPQDTSNYEIYVTFISNAGGAGNDSVSNWQGKGMQPGPQIDNMFWGEKRVLTEHDGELTMINKGNSEVTINSFELENPADPNFEIDQMGITPQPPVELYQEGTTGEITEIKIPVKYKPQSEGDHTNAVIPVFEKEKMNELGIKGSLTGTGILPKIELIGYEFQSAVKKGAQHPDTGFVRIKSTSETADLKIFSISWANPGQQQFEFVRNTLPSDTVITRNEHFDIDVIFHPTIVQQDIVETVEVVSDADTGDNPQVTSDTVVIGHSYDTGLEVGNINFGTEMTCETPVKSFSITNNSMDKKLVIKKLEFSAGDFDNFDTLSVPNVIQPNSSEDVEVQFLPDDPVDYNLDIIIHYDFVDMDDYVVESGTAPTFCKGKGEIVNTQLSTPTLENMTPGYLTIGDYEFSVDINCDDFSKAKITSFMIVIKYPSEDLRWNGNTGDELIPGNALDDTWNITAEEIPNPVSGTTKLVLDGSGTNPISNPGKLTSIEFQVMLGDAEKFKPEFDIIEYGEREKCVTKETNNGYINVLTCVSDLRSIIANPEPYFLNQPQPNPVKSDAFTLKYSIGLKSHTRIELWNSTGVAIKTLLDELSEPGFYEKEINIENLSSGVYFIRIISGPYLKVRRMVVQK